MRFLLRIAFWLALIAFFLPSFGEDDSQAVGVNYLGAFVGAQQALSDMGGFCERAPAACSAGRDVGSFVAARVTDGLAYGYSTIQGRTGEPAAAPAPQTAESPAARAVRAAAPPQEAATRTARPAPAENRAPTPREASPARPPAADPMQTAAVAAERVRRAAGLEPFAMPGLGERPAKANEHRPSGFIHAGNARAIPLPTPRP